MRKFIAASLACVLPVLVSTLWSTQASAALIDIVVVGTWESTAIDPVINKFGLNIGDKFVIRSTYDDATFFNGSEGVTSDVDPGINPGTSLNFIIPHAGVAPNPVEFDQSDHINIGFAPNVQIEFDGPNAGSPGNFRNFEFHFENNFAGDSMQYDQFKGPVQIETDIFNVSQGFNLPAIGVGDDHLEVVQNDITANAGGPYVFNAGNLSLNLSGTSGGGSGFSKVFDWTGPGGTLTNSPGSSIALGLAESGLSNTVDTEIVSLSVTENFTEFQSSSDNASVSYANTAPVALSAMGVNEVDFSITFSGTADDVDLVANALVANFEDIDTEFLFMGNQFLAGSFGNLDLTALVGIFGSFGIFEVEFRVTDFASATDSIFFDIEVPEPGTFALLGLGLIAALGRRSRV